MRILIADDHSIVRSGLKHLLGELGDDIVIDEANTFDQALEICAEPPRPDLVIFDLFMPGLENLDALPTLVARMAPAPTVAFSMDETPERMRAVIERGARAYIPKSTDDSVVIGILRLVLAGGTYVPPALALAASPTAVDDGAEWSGKAADIAALTRRQRQVLALLSEGLSNMEIGSRLNLNLSTVKTHVTGVLKALGVDNRTQAVLVFKRAGQEMRQNQSA